MPPKESGQSNVEIHEDESADCDLPMPTSLAGVAEMAGWWPGMGSVLIPKDANVANGRNSSQNADDITVRVRTTKSIERELIDNFMDADSRGCGFSMITGGQRRFLEAVAEIENQKCKEKKRKGSKHQIKPYLEEEFPALNYGEPYKREAPSSPSLVEKVLGHDEKTGEPQVQISCRWSPSDVRNKVQKLLQSPASSLTITELCQQMDVTLDEYTKFMSVKSFNGKIIPRFYFHAAYYFAKKDEGLVPIDPEYSGSRKRKSPSGNGGNDTDGEDGDSGNGSNKRAKTTDGSGPASNNTNTQKTTSDKAKSKKQQLKDEENAMYDVSGVQLTEYADREAAGEVPVYETCISIRRMIATHLKNRTKADLIRSLLPLLPPSGPKSLQTSQLTHFQEAKGSRGGASTSCFYVAYLFFEKLRIKQGKPKSKFRLEMEDIWGDKGMDRWDPAGKHILLLAGEKRSDFVKFDKYGAHVRPW